MSTDPSAAGSTRSQRSLAAIVFTDVVSFSARMHADEVGTLKLLERDFAEMRRVCAEHEGEVLKTTGDGLLLTFVSAVQAVACALAMQRKFAAAAKDQVPGGALQHRIGIHLGDVLIQDRDVMGDGVNIAARLQAEAEPGGICISQTVYDVVKNKLEMQAVSLGARELKNISSAVPVYRLLLEAQSLEPASSASAVIEPSGGSGRKRGLALVRGGRRHRDRPRRFRTFRPPQLPGSGLLASGRCTGATFRRCRWQPARHPGRRRFAQGPDGPDARPLSRPV